MNYANKYREWKPLTLKEMGVNIRDSFRAKRFFRNNNVDELLNTPRIQIIGLHHLFDDTIENFQKTLQFLSKYFEFIGYSEALNRIFSNRIDRPYLAITSDDGLKNNLNLVQVLKEHNISCCFFLVTSMVGEKNSTKVSKFSRNVLNKCPAEFMDFSDIELLLKDGHEIGSHSVTHPNFAEVDINMIIKEIKDSFEFLSRHFNKIEHFAWPYGGIRHFSQEAIRVVFEAGYISCASMESGSHTKGTRDYKDLILKRTHIDPAFHCDTVKYLLTKNGIENI